MAKYLINRTDIFRVDNEQEAKDFIEELKSTSGGDVVKHSIEYKEQKQKGELVQSWYRVTVKTVYNEEKDPISPYHEPNNVLNFSN